MTGTLSPGSAGRLPAQVRTGRTGRRAPRSTRRPRLNPGPAGVHRGHVDGARSAPRAALPAAGRIPRSTAVARWRRAPGQAAAAQRGRPPACDHAHRPAVLGDHRRTCSPTPSGRRDSPARLTPTRSRSSVPTSRPEPCPRSPPSPSTTWAPAPSTQPSSDDGRREQSSRSPCRPRRWPRGGSDLDDAVISHVSRGSSCPTASRAPPTRPSTPPSAAPLHSRQGETSCPARPTSGSTCRSTVSRPSRPSVGPSFL